MRLFVLCVFFNLAVSLTFDSVRQISTVRSARNTVKAEFNSFNSNTYTPMGDRSRSSRKKLICLSNNASEADFSVVGLSPSTMRKMRIENGDNILLLGNMLHKSVGIAVRDSGIRDDNCVVHSKMLLNVRSQAGENITLYSMNQRPVEADQVILYPFASQVVDSSVSEPKEISIGRSNRVKSPAMKITSDDIFSNFLSPFFEDAYRPLTVGDVITINRKQSQAMSGNNDANSVQSLEFKVMNITNSDGVGKSIGVVGPNTELIFEDRMLDDAEDTRAVDMEFLNNRNSYKFSQIGGYGKQIEQIRELIELPLRFPELYRAVGISPPRGLLLIGPPGSGKTSIAKAVVSEIGAHLVTISGAEILSKMTGESEANLRKAFELAKNKKPAVILVDEVESLVPKRDARSGEGDRRLVTQFGTLLDELRNMENVVVIATTSKPNSVDPSIRRFGRLEKEIQLHVPDDKGRKEILDIKTNLVKISENVNLDDISKQTHGFVGADIAQLVNEAGYDAVHSRAKVLREALDDAVGGNDVLALDDSGNEVIHPSLLDSMIVNETNFKRALKSVNPSSIRDNIVEIPNISWNDVGGLDAVKQELFESIQYPIQYPGIYEKFGLSPSRGVLFYGPPGCGKTMLAKAIANECGANFISIKGPELLSMWFGESEANVRDIFDKARAAAPCILFFDEIDSLAKVRGDTANSGSEAADRVMNQILTEIDGISSGGSGSGSNKNIFVIGATNRPEVLDPAVTRPGRLDQLIYIPLPDANARLGIFKATLRKTPVTEDVTKQLDKLVNMTEGFSGADITELCQRAVKLAIREIVVGKAAQSNTKVTYKHFTEAFNYARKSVQQSDLMKYAQFASRMNVDTPEDLLEASKLNNMLAELKNAVPPLDRKIESGVPTSDNKEPEITSMNMDDYFKN